MLRRKKILDAGLARGWQAMMQKKIYKIIDYWQVYGWKSLIFSFTHITTRSRLAILIPPKDDEFRYFLLSVHNLESNKKFQFPSTTQQSANEKFASIESDERRWLNSSSLLWGKYKVIRIDGAWNELTSASECVRLDIYGVFVRSLDFCKHFFPFPRKHISHDEKLREM